MNTRLLAIACALAAVASADTLRLRSGRTVVGNWLGGAADEVRFMVDGQLQRYPRADVAEVIFSGTSDGPTPPPPPIVDEPQITGAPFLRGANGLIPLERETGMLMRNGGMYGMGGTVYRVPGPSSPVRVNQRDRIAFVVRLRPGDDPRRFALYRLESRMNYRQTQPTPGGMPPALPVSIVKAGESTYEISPSRPLYPGEYSMSPMNSNESYCFGVNY
jgi:hypothetical protein